MTDEARLRSSTFMLPSLLESVADSFNVSALDKGLQILLDVAPDLAVEVRGDEQKLRAILSDTLIKGIAIAENGAVIIAAGLADWCRQTVTVRFKVILDCREMFTNLAEVQELVAALGGKLSASFDGERQSTYCFAIPLELVTRKEDWDTAVSPL